MELFEQAVLAYLTGPPQRFVHPQYSFTYRDGVGGSTPDFVVLDFAGPTAYVVEVTAAYNIQPLIDRVRDRENRWYVRLREHLATPHLNRIAWKIHTTIFVRADRKNDALKALGNETDVTVIALDDIMRSWKWNWEKQTPLNPLDRDPTESAAV
jgi:hypothetical protein